MNLVFRTQPEGEAVEINGVGYAGPDAKGGIFVKDAAELMPELQNEDREPLKGPALKKAAEAFAEARGLQVVDAPDDVDFRAELGYPEDNTPSVMAQATRWNDLRPADEVNPDAPEDAIVAPSLVPAPEEDNK